MTFLTFWKGIKNGLENSVGIKAGKISLELAAPQRRMPFLLAWSRNITLSQRKCFKCITVKPFEEPSKLTQYYNESYFFNKLSKYMSLSCNHLLLGSYYTYCSNFWWIVLFIFITALIFLLYVLFEKKVDRTVSFYYCTALPIIHTVLKK